VFFFKHKLISNVIDKDIVIMEHLVGLYRISSTHYCFTVSQINSLGIKEKILIVNNEIVSWVCWPCPTCWENDVGGSLELRSSAYSDWFSDLEPMFSSM
jgi:hypothetical protein